MRLIAAYGVRNVYYKQQGPDITARPSHVCGHRLLSLYRSSCLAEAALKHNTPCPEATSHRYLKHVRGIIYYTN